MKINMTGDSWDALLRIVRDTATEGSDTSTTKKPNGRASYMDDEGDDGEGDDENPGPSRDVKEWRTYAQGLRKVQGKYRTERNDARRQLAEIQAQREADKAAREADLAALRTESENAKNAAIAEARAAGDQRLVRYHLKAALGAEKCKDVDDALKIIDASGIKISDAGDVEGAEALIAELKKSKPYLFDGVASSTTSSTSATPPRDAGGAKHAKDMSKEEYDAALRKFTGGGVRR